MPGRQLDEMSGAHRVLVEACGIVWMKGPWMQVRQILGAAGQTLFQLLQGEIKKKAQMTLHRQAILDEGIHVHGTAAAELWHGSDGSADATV